MKNDVFAVRFRKLTVEQINILIKQLSPYGRLISLENTSYYTNFYIEIGSNWEIESVMSEIKLILSLVYPHLKPIN